MDSANQKVLDYYGQPAVNDQANLATFDALLTEEDAVFQGILNSIPQLENLFKEIGIQRVKKETVAVPHHAQVVNPVQVQPIAEGNSVKLPKLEIESYDGNILRWNTFWDSFEPAIHHRHGLTDVEKFNYLRSKLVGDAANAISGLQCTNVNYQVAIDLLKTRFGNKQAILDAHYLAVTNLPTVPNNIVRLRQFYDYIEQHFRSLEAMGHDVNQNSCFITLLKSRLPVEVLHQMNLQMAEDEEWTVESLRKRLGRYIISYESISPTLLSSGISEYHPQVMPGPGMSSGRNFLSNSSSGYGSKTKFPYKSVVMVCLSPPSTVYNGH